MTERITLLIIDNDKDTRDLIQDSFSDELYNIILIENDASVIDTFKNIQPDLIILNARPDINGYEICRQIRRLETGKYIPLIFMSTLHGTEPINQAYAAGATDFIITPFNPLLLNYRIQFLLEARQTSDELRDTKSRLEIAQQVAQLGHWQWTAKDNKFIWSEEISRIMGFPETQTSALFSQVIERFHPEDKYNVKSIIQKAIQNKSSYSIEHRLILNDGTSRTVSQEADIFFDMNGQIEKIVGTLQDISSKKQSEDQINNLSHYNKVTGLPNRTLLKRLLDKYINNANAQQPVVILTISLDRYKLITDSYGHAFGENLSRKIAIRLIRSIKGSTYFNREDYENIFQKNVTDKPLTIAHCDGDEFVVVLPEITEVDNTALIARKISDALSVPYKISKQEIRVTASIGISVYPIDGKNTDTLLKSSASALYHAKRQGGDGYKFFTSKMNDRAFERLTLETSLRKAIDEQQFTLYYQPKMSLTENKIVGMEALLRWNHPEHGIIPPEKFINILEKTGLIIPLGERIIESVCQQIKQWREEGYLPLPVAINLSPVQLKQKAFHLHFLRILKKYKVSPKMIELEITESTLMNDMDKTITMLKKLRLPGTQVSLDDFGTGYSSLTYLKHFPVNTLKIDRSFIQNVTVNSDDAVIVKGVIALAHGMRLKVVAEGIEESIQLDFLQSAGCDYGQGYFFSKPLDVITFTELFMKKIDQKSSATTTNIVS